MEPRQDRRKPVLSEFNLAEMLPEGKTSFGCEG
jgi:hypothetical protein